MIEQKVELGSRSYCIHIGEGAFDESLKVLNASPRALESFLHRRQRRSKGSSAYGGRIEKGRLHNTYIRREHTKCFAKLADICSVLARWSR
ncbi:MAG: hypothetical protein ACLUKN_02775 [Bacilli bacterium]